MNLSIYIIWVLYFWLYSHFGYISVSFISSIWDLNLKSVKLNPICQGGKGTWMLWSSEFICNESIEISQAQLANKNFSNQPIWTRVFQQTTLKSNTSCTLNPPCQESGPHQLPPTTRTSLQALVTHSRHTHKLLFQTLTLLGTARQHF